VEPAILEWIALTPEKVQGDQALVFREITDAFDVFRTEYEKGNGTAVWLKDRALDEWPDSITWICWDRVAKRVAAFFSVGKIKLDAEELGSVRFQADLAPASEIKNLRRDVHARLSEDQLVKDAVSTAIEDWQAVHAGDVTIVLDPAGAKLHREHDFWFECADKKRIWARFRLEGKGTNLINLRP
jgi:hypothetical protein